MLNCIQVESGPIWKEVLLHLLFPLLQSESLIMERPDLSKGLGWDFLRCWMVGSWWCPKRWLFGQVVSGSGLPPLSSYLSSHWWSWQNAHSETLDTLYKRSLCKDQSCVRMKMCTNCVFECTSCWKQCNAERWHPDKMLIFIDIRFPYCSSWFSTQICRKCLSSAHGCMLVHAILRQADWILVLFFFKPYLDLNLVESGGLPWQFLDIWRGCLWRGESGDGLPLKSMVYSAVYNRKAAVSSREISCISRRTWGPTWRLAN